MERLPSRYGLHRRSQLTVAEIDMAKIRTHRDQNLVVVSTPEFEVTARVQELPAITVNGCQFEILAYIALPDNSCRVITGLDSRPTSKILSTRIRAQGVKVICARIMGQTNTAIINSEGLKVPYYVYFRGAKYRCLPHQPREQICTACLGLGHRVDICPHPEENKFCRCGKPGKNRPRARLQRKMCQLWWVASSHRPKVSGRQRGQLNKAHVRRHQLNRLPPVQRKPLPVLLRPRQKSSAPSTKVAHPQPRLRPSHAPLARVEFASMKDPTPAEAAAMEQGQAPNPKKRNRNPPELPGQPPAVPAAELSDSSEPASEVRLKEPPPFKPTPFVKPPPEPSPTQPIPFKPTPSLTPPP
ncbi:hypothetical protein HPB47_010985 [Ixodes persulcatus]|uniref:Uncharacterized protein n=1 Tax=Ixodes persulcatus TaxID=34615 RepID=A0AC60NXS0_IXOPE|nr:hypothetical protein HPB47_010985 [Ixodes persulcatus]